MIPPGKGFQLKGSIVAVDFVQQLDHHVVPAGHGGRKLHMVAQSQQMDEQQPHFQPPQLLGAIRRFQKTFDHALQKGLNAAAFPNAEIKIRYAAFPRAQRVQQEAPQCVFRAHHFQRKVKDLWLHDEIHGNVILTAGVDRMTDEAIHEQQLPRLQPNLLPAFQMMGHAAGQHKHDLYIVMPVPRKGAEPGMLPDHDGLIDRQQALAGKRGGGRRLVQAHVQRFAPKQPFLLRRGFAKIFSQ